VRWVNALPATGLLESVPVALGDDQVGVVQQPVDCCGSEGLGMIVSKPDGWMLLVTAIKRRSQAASTMRWNASAASWPAGGMPMPSTTMRSLRQIPATVRAVDPSALARPMAAVQRRKGKPGHHLRNAPSDHGVTTA
jgi:hypothetical protein